jgi:hypothetical protein
VDVRVIIVGDKIGQLIILPHTKDLLEEGQRILLPYLVKIFWASLVTGYISGIWHQDKFMFIPKPSKNPYSGPRDFRLISLTSFLFKTMDKMVDRFLRDEILANKPLHPNQHTRRAVKSVEMIRHQLMVGVEKEHDLQQTALGVFSDTEGAFNNTSYDSKCAALFKHGVDYNIIWWIRATSGCGNSWWIFQDRCSILGLTTVSCFVTTPMVPCY